ncbi:MAG: hypothetical protein HQ581_27590, partial [Planctomycetes bacterium]|nr:hypothetical protein [Planctomycetota bacterium]
MATCEWLGYAEAVAMVRSETPANVEDTDIFSIIMGRKIVTFTATAAGVPNAVAGLVAAWNASTEHEHKTVTAADVGTTHVSLTADTAGTEFSVTTTAVDGGGADTQTLADAITTANSGPSVWADVDNWSDHDADGVGEVPAAGGDTVFIANSSSDILYGLDQNALDMTAVNVDSTFTGTIGLPNYNEDDGLGYPEYKTTYLKMGSTTVNVGLGGGAGSGRIKWDGDTTASTINLYKTGTRAETGIPCMLVLAIHATNVLNNYGGDVGVAFFAGEVSTFLTFTQEGTASKTVLGSGVTHQAGGTITVEAGTFTAYCAVKAVTIKGGTVTLDSTADSITQSGGTATVTGAVSGDVAMTGGTLSMDSTVNAIDLYTGTLTVAGAVATTVDMTEGTLTLESTVTTVNQSGGTVTIAGTALTFNVTDGTLTSEGAITTVNAQDSTVVLNGNIAGTITQINGTLTIGETATVHTMVLAGENNESGTCYYESNGELGT